MASPIYRSVRISLRFEERKATYCPGQNGTEVKLCHKQRRRDVQYLTIDIYNINQSNACTSPTLLSWTGRRRVTPEVTALPPRPI